jgi:hypothetical protein
MTSTRVSLIASFGLHGSRADSAYVFVGGLAYELTEGDVITILSQ